MDLVYKISDTTLNGLSEFFNLHGRIYTLIDWIDADMIQEVTSASSNLAAYSAVALDKKPLNDLQSLEGPNLIDILPKLDLDTQQDILRYKNLLDNFDQYICEPSDLSTANIRKLHSDITGDITHDFRTESKTLKMDVWENGVYRKVNFEINKPIEEIEPRIDAFSNWFVQNYNMVNPVILAAIAHYQISKIHPYSEGTGRLSKLLSRGVLRIHDIDRNILFPIDDFYIRNQEYYFGTIEKAIQDSDLTHWIEFVTHALLDSAIQTSKFIFEASGGSLDLINSNIVPLNSNERKVIRVIREFNMVTGAEIARQIGVSRQYANVVLKQLIKKKLVKKAGAHTSIRYQLINV